MLFDRFRIQALLALFAATIVQITPVHAQLNATYEECRTDWIRRYELKLENDPTEYADRFINTQLLPNLDRDQQNIWRLVTLRGLSLSDAISDHIVTFRGSATEDENTQLRQLAIEAVAPLIELREAIASTQYVPLDPNHAHLGSLIDSHDEISVGFGERIAFWQGQNSPFILDQSILVATAVAQIRLEHDTRRGVPAGTLPTLLSCGFWDSVFRWESTLRYRQIEADDPDAFAVLEEFQFRNQAVFAAWNDAFGIYRK